MYICDNFRSELYKFMIPEETNYKEYIPRLAMSLGINKTSYNEKGEMLIGHMPLSLNPYQLTSQTYEKLIIAHRVWQNLIVKVASDKEFLKNTLSKAIVKDQFLKRLFDIYENCPNQNQVGVATTRIDYMGDENPNLVEFNLMSVGLNGITERVQELTNILKLHRSKGLRHTYPVNKNQIVFVDALTAGLQQKFHSKQGFVAMIVVDNEFNYGDQNAFYMEMMKRGYNIIRFTMQDFMGKMKYEEETKKIYYGDKLISCFYFRSSYAPRHFPTQQHWRVRQIIQSSNTIKAPSLVLQLINCKRMQAQLSKLQVLDKFLPKSQAQLIHELSGNIYDFDNSENIQNLISLAEKQDCVLKANREGGGSNYFGEQALKMLKQMKGNEEQLQQYILMKKIQSTILSHEFIANFKSQWVDKATCEFSTFGSFMFKGDKIIYNEAGGSLVRFKRQQVNEGGIAIDQAVIAGLCLTDQI